MIKKFCTKHGIDYLGECCPKCAATPESEPKSEKKVTPAPKKKKPKMKSTRNDAALDEKIKALMNKWNTKKE